MTDSKLDSETKKRLLNLLNRAKIRELIYVETVLQKAYLAAFQVHGKRLEFLETKTEKSNRDELSLQDFFLDVLIDLIVVGGAGKLLKAGIK